MLNQIFTGACEFDGSRSATRACFRAMERIRAGTWKAESIQRKHPCKLPKSSALSQLLGPRGKTCLDMTMMAGTLCRRRAAMSTPGWAAPDKLQITALPTWRPTELKSILTRISTQISDMERRHGDALDAMADQLSQMGGQAQTAKARTPVQDAQAFERIEDSLADLAARIANAGQGHAADVAPVQFAEQIALPEMPTVLGGQAPVQTDGEVFKVASAVAPAANGAHEAAEPSANPAQGEP